VTAEWSLFWFLFTLAVLARVYLIYRDR